MTANDAAPSNPAIETHDKHLPDSPTAWTLPGSGVQLCWREVPLAAIAGVDPDLDAVLQAHFAQLAHPIDLQAWTPQALAWVYARTPLVLKPRRSGRDYSIIGTGVPLLLWQHAAPGCTTVAAWVIERPARLDLTHKYAIFAAEVMGLCALYGSHRRQLSALYGLWQALQTRAPEVASAAGVLREGSGAAFARAMGCSTAVISGRARHRSTG
ncbi:hypothetical protein [Caldimonas thermodepolymerans]|jgi:hypothetical protein|uniref:hypothetical protein n=1 Tax=Caldimonas thermodepolymerans TaxID=215580 RepID=UPI002235CFE3|nr:hypothetical protein [Caldimonas thermodepolymerans]UZG46030.1 hypothetical protein ONZ46_08845 [Caldimonas thermodepolymerans]